MSQRLSQITATDIYSFFRPSQCELRINLKNKNFPESEPSPYEDVIKTLGHFHELKHLETLQDVLNLSQGTIVDRNNKTKLAINEKKGAIYQGVFILEKEINNQNIIFIGIPDFLISENDSYIIRDSKVSRRINERDHPEIFHSLKFYGWLFTESMGILPTRLEVHSGSNELITIPYNHDSNEVPDLLNLISNFKFSECEPYSPVGWTKCNGCGFHSNCWTKAKEINDPAIICGVDKGLAEELRRSKIHTIDKFLKTFDEKTLCDFKRPWGKKFQKVGKRSKNILLAAQALHKNKEFLIKIPELPTNENYVMFDLEGMPPQLDEVDKIYLWGLQVFGKSPGPFQPALAGFGENGDFEGWNNFLTISENIFQKYGEIPFIHWHHYERTKVNQYLERYGDNKNKIGEKVLKNLFDLLPITQASIILPLPSYSLKEVEKYVGFQRSQKEYGGDWAMAKFIEATELEDQEQRDEIIDQIVKYNEEDLLATWEVFKWLNLKK